MKFKASLLSIFVLVFVLSTFTGCSLLDKGLKALPYSFVATSEDATVDVMKKVVKAFDAKDKEAVKSLFAKNVLKQYHNFDKDLDKAFRYYTIKSDKVKYEYSGDSDAIYEGLKTTYAGSTADVKNGNEGFSFSIEICIEDSSDEANIGLWNISIVDNNAKNFKGIYSDDDDEEDDNAPKYGIYIE